MDIMWNRGGSLFKPVEQEGPQPAAQFLAPGPFGSWKGGLIDGVEAGGITVGVRYAVNNPLRCLVYDRSCMLESDLALSLPQVYDYSVVHTVTNLPHFGGDLREFSSCSESYVKLAASHRYWGPTISSWAGFKATADWIGGWAGLAKLCREARIETAVVRWRKQGWVALEVPTTTATKALAATVVLRPIVAPVGTTHVTVNLQVANDSCAQVSLERVAARSSSEHKTQSLLLPKTVPIEGYSGAHAARACEDATAQVLAWAGKTALPTSSEVGASGGVVLRIELPPGARLFGLTFASK